MTWFKVDDRLHAHPKTLATSLAALGLWTVAGSWSSDHRTGGVLPDHVLPLLSRGASELADELVAAGLWRRVRGGYQFHDWSQFNPTREEAIAQSSQKSIAGAIGNHRRWHVDRGRTDPGCPFCQDELRSHTESQVRGGSDRIANRPDPPPTNDYPPNPPPDGGGDDGHHRQHANCRACGTNPRGKPPPPEPEPEPLPSPWLPSEDGTKSHLENLASVERPPPETVRDALAEAREAMQRRGRAS